MPTLTNTATSTLKPQDGMSCYPVLTLLASFQDEHSPIVSHAVRKSKGLILPTMHLSDVQEYGAQTPKLHMMQQQVMALMPCRDSQVGTKALHLASSAPHCLLPFL